MGRCDRECKKIKGNDKVIKCPLSLVVFIFGLVFCESYFLKIRLSVIAL